MPCAEGTDADAGRGCASAAFTLGTYCHVTDEMRSESARLMESFIEKLL